MFYGEASLDKISMRVLGSARPRQYAANSLMAISLKQYINSLRDFHRPVKKDVENRVFTPPPQLETLPQAGIKSQECAPYGSETGKIS
jgi:hypothetical protein